MAKRVEMVLVDDLDGTSAADETIRFALDGTDYEIDLTSRHAAELRAAFNAFVGAARRVNAGRSTSRRR